MGDEMRTILENLPPAQHKDGWRVIRAHNILELCVRGEYHVIDDTSALVVCRSGNEYLIKFDGEHYHVGDFKTDNYDLFLDEVMKL